LSKRNNNATANIQDYKLSRYSLKELEKEKKKLEIKEQKKLVETK
jgi:hypothetical protein